MCLMSHCMGKSIHLVIQLCIACQHEVLVHNVLLQKEQRRERKFEENHFIYANTGYILKKEKKGGGKE